MFRVERKFVRKSASSAPCKGAYQYRVTATAWQDNWMLNTTGWQTETEYRAWKESIIEEDFPHE